MNVRIKNQNLRFKITKEELITLLGGHSIYEKIVLLDKALVVTINPNGRGEEMKPKLVLDQEDAYLNLLIPPPNVRTLFDMGQSREGLVQEINGISVALQVDIPEACHP